MLTSCDAIAANNLEVLFFDESIDLANSKPTPFLNDTSQAHNASNKCERAL